MLAANGADLRRASPSDSQLNAAFAMLGLASGIGGEIMYVGKFQHNASAPMDE